MTVEYWSITDDILDAVAADIVVNPTRYGLTANTVSKWTGGTFYRNVRKYAAGLDPDLLVNLGYAPVLVWTKTDVYTSTDWHILYTDTSTTPLPTDITDPEQAPINVKVTGWKFVAFSKKQVNTTTVTSTNKVKAGTTYASLTDVNPVSGNKRVWAVYEEVTVTFVWDTQKTGASKYTPKKNAKWFDTDWIGAKANAKLKGYYLPSSGAWKVKKASGTTVTDSMSIGDIVYAQLGTYDDTVSTVTIYAQWKAYQYTVVFKKWTKGSSTSSTTKKIYWNGALSGATNLTTQTYGGVKYTFVGWFKNPGGVGTPVTTSTLLKEIASVDNQSSSYKYYVYAYWVVQGTTTPGAINPSSSGSATPLAALSAGSGATALAALSDDSGGGGTGLAALSGQDVAAVTVEPLTLASEPAQDETVAMLALLSEATTDSSMGADAAAGASASAIGQMVAAGDAASAALLGVASDAAAVISAADGASETALSDANAGDAVLAENGIGDASGFGLVALSSDPDSAGGYPPQALEDDVILSVVGSDGLAAAICQLETGASPLAAVINQDALQAAYSTDAVQGLVA